MKPGERAHAILSEFSTQYFFVIREDDGLRVGMSAPAFARAVLPDLEDAINKAEHHEKQQEARDARIQEDEKPPEKEKDE